MRHAFCDVILVMGIRIDFIFDGSEAIVGIAGRTPIGSYVKFVDIADQIIEGLSKLGMNIESL